jgi:phosphatidylserine decarboxylase
MASHYTSLLSRLFGRFAATSFPGPFQRLINRSYVRLMGLEMGEFAPAESYTSLNRLFTRALKAERSIDPDPRAVIAPCDALITDLGRITGGEAYQIKGMAYDTAALLGEYHAAEAKRLEGGDYANFYLSPRDYHRYHAPMDLEVESVTHIPGRLYPVNMPLLKNKLNLFIENERVILQTTDRQGRCHFLVLVGALNVGKMVVTFEERIHTNTAPGPARHYRYETPIPLKRGELFGWFEMGSTIVMLSEAGALKYEIEAGSKVRFAQTIARLEESA